jgi:xanthosine utilization system XapX-like protein
MPPAYGAAFLWLMTTILWWSGWREEASEGIPHWAVGAFLAVWPFAWLGNVVVTPNFTVNGAWIWTFLAGALLARRTHAKRRWTAISAGLLVGSIYVLVSRLAHYPTGFSHYLDPWGAAIVVGFLTSLIVRSVSEQVLAISTGLYVSMGIYAYLQTASGTIFEGKASEWMAGWWIAVLSSRLSSLTVRALADLARKWTFKVGEKRGDQRS